jgi:hypothetical protein
MMAADFLTRSMIAKEVWTRNQLRRSAQLPLLNVPSEINRLMRIEALNRLHAEVHALQPLRPALVAKWIERERRRRNDREFSPIGRTMWRAIDHHVNSVLSRVLRKRGISMPVSFSSPYLVCYDKDIPLMS